MHSPSPLCRWPGLWVYIKSEPRLWTVGYWDLRGQWQTDSDHDSQGAAADRTAYLNGHSPHELAATDPRD